MSQSKTAFLINRIGILGCGWLGFPLAKALLKKGYKVSGTTTSKDKIDRLQSAGITPFLVQLSENRVDCTLKEFLSSLHALIINVPPALRRNPQLNYVKKMQVLLRNIEINSSLKHVIFISSTSVYGNLEGEITEDSKTMPRTESGKQLLQSEELFRKHKNISATIIRFGGLIGPERHPVNHLSGKENLRNGDELVNLIHLDDCIHMITTIMENGYWGEVFNGVYPYHPKKEDYYTDEAKKKKIPIPQYSTSELKIRKKSIISRNFLNKEHRFYTSIVS